MFFKNNLSIDKDLIKELKRVYSKQEIEILVESLLERYFNDLSKNITEEQHSEKKISEEIIELENQMRFVDKILYCTTHIRIGINKYMVGSTEYKYSLVGYKIDAINNTIDLNLVRKEDDYTIRFIDVVKIDSNANKFWIYSKNETTRFWADVDMKKYTELSEGFRTENIELIEDIQCYNQYLETNKRMYYAEKFKYENKKYGCDFKEKIVQDKRGNKMTLITVLELELDSVNDVMVFSDQGQLGSFYYKLNRDSLFIVDILPKVHSCGIGSEVLNFMEEIARENHKSTMTGNLSLDDYDHLDRLIYFYEKNGFVVNDKKSKIRKVLN